MQEKLITKRLVSNIEKYELLIAGLDMSSDSEIVKHVLRTEDFIGHLVNHLMSLASYSTSDQVNGSISLTLSAIGRPDLIPDVIQGSRTLRKGSESTDQDFARLLKSSLSDKIESYSLSAKSMDL